MVSQTGHSVSHRSATRPKMNWLFSSMQPENPKANATSSTAWTKTAGMRLAALVLFSVVAASGCGDKPPPSGPFILTDRSSLGWGREFASAVYVGTSTLQSLDVSNKGL